MDEIERRLGTLTRQMSTPKKLQKSHSILDSYDKIEREEVRDRGTAILGALKRGGGGGGDDVDYHFLAGSVASYGSGRKPYLVCFCFCFVVGVVVGGCWRLLGVVGDCWELFVVVVVVVVVGN